MTWTSEVIPGGYQFTSADHGAHIVLDYITPIARGLEAWVELRVDGDDTPVASGQRNLMVPRAAAPFLQDAGESEIPWADGLRHAFYFAIEAYRSGAATLDLATVEPGDLTFIIDPLVESGGNTRLIAPGGFGKSFLALAVALTVATGKRKFLGLEPQTVGPVLYLDWETNPATHAQRLAALCSAVDEPTPSRDLLWYRFEAQPLHRVVQAVERAVARTGAVMVIIDSRALAAGASGQSSGEDATLGLNTALREIGRPALIIDHKNREDIRRDRKGGIGSIFNRNLARMEWEFTRYTTVGPRERHFVLSLEKENNVGELAPLGFRFTTTGGKTGIKEARFDQIPASDIYGQSDADIGDRVLLLFTTSTEPMTVDRIAELTGAKVGSVRSRLNTDDRFFNVNEGKKGKVGLWRPKEEWLVGPTDDGEQDAFPDEVPGWLDEPPVF